MRKKNSCYVKYCKYTKKKLKNDLVSSVIPLLFAVGSALVPGGVFSCILAIFSILFSLGTTLRGLKKEYNNYIMKNGAFVLLGIFVPFFMGQFSAAAFAIVMFKIMQSCVAFAYALLGGELRRTAEILPKETDILDEHMCVVRVPSKNVGYGTKFIVKKDEIVPVDCVVTEGYTEFDPRLLYGSTTLVSASKGKQIYAGFINRGSAVTCSAVCAYAESAVNRLNGAATACEKTMSGTEKHFSKYAKFYPHAFLVIAIVVVLLGGFVGKNWSDAIVRACVVLSCACTGAYYAAIPMLSACMSWKLKENGCCAENLSCIDDLADVTTVIFEKKGVATTGEYGLETIKTTEGVSKDDLLMMLSATLSSYQHPVCALFSAYKNPHVKAEDVITFPGKGLECSIAEKRIYCGNKDFMRECDIDCKAFPSASLYLAIEKNIMGAVEIKDTVNADCGGELNELRACGVEKTILFSSETEEKTKNAYLASGADMYYAEMTDRTRVEEIKTLRKQDHVVAYISDGTDSKEALAVANIGVCLTDGKSATPTKCKIFSLGYLSSLSKTVVAARAYCSKMELHFYCIAATKLILLLLAIFGTVNVAAVFLVEGLLSVGTLLSAKKLFENK